MLLLLMGGVALGLTHSPNRYFRIIREMHAEWKKINRMSLRRAVKSLYQSKLLREMANTDGTITLVLNERGKKTALRYNLETLRLIVPNRWDKKWRIVMFDVPERLKKVRDSFRFHLRQLGFKELQKSVFVHPANCEKEVTYLIEFYNVRRFVRYIVADSIDTELHLKQQFHM
ncbi:MAG TPA: CRISPR-associated endonuclease Cas2 [Candidatus Paceibacterota bacterium]